jgi:hypothetical protein
MGLTLMIFLLQKERWRNVAGLIEDCAAPLPETLADFARLSPEVTLEARPPVPGLPELSGVEISFVRRSGTEGGPLIDAVEEALMPGRQEQGVHGGRNSSESHAR